MLNRGKWPVLVAAPSNIFAILGLALMLLMSACGQTASLGAGASTQNPSAANPPADSTPAQSAKAANKPAEAGITAPVTLKIADGLFNF